jgi:hypothetical protein
MKLPVLPVPDLARVRGESKDEVISWLLGYYQSPGAPFNYISGTRSIKASYKGFRSLEQLMAGCDRERTEIGKSSNREIVKLAAPLAFERNTQVFDLPRRRFAFGRDYSSSYRIPFFFVEDNTVKLYYLQPRKRFGLTFDEFGMVATIYKSYLLDTEFFGQKADVEFVDLSIAADTGARGLRNYSLGQLRLWSEERLAERLTLIAEALDFLNESDLVQPRKRRVQTSQDMPLF